MPRLPANYITVVINCVFCKIRDGEIPKEFTYQDEDVIVFPDINPVKPVHLLIVSKKHIADFTDTENSIFEKMFTIAQKMVKAQKLEDKGYRLLINGGGAQIIDHLHVHLMGPMGRQVKD